MHMEIQRLKTTLPSKTPKKMNKMEVTMEYMILTSDDLCVCLSAICDELVCVELSYVFELYH